MSRAALGAITGEGISRSLTNDTPVSKFGLTSKRWQSGISIDVKGRISTVGHGATSDTRFYEAATVTLKRFKGKDAIKSWGFDRTYQITLSPEQTPRIDVDRIKPASVQTRFDLDRGLSIVAPFCGGPPRSSQDHRHGCGRHALAVQCCKIASIAATRWASKILFLRRR
jgi:hypothetical protein